MIEAMDYGLQFLILTVCGIYSGAQAAGHLDRGWLILAFAYFCYALGDLYWLLCVTFDGHIPRISYISEISWFASMIFLCLLLRELQAGSVPMRRWQVWIPPLIASAACLYFFRWGDYFTNLLDALLMGRLGYLAIKGLLSGGGGAYQLDRKPVRQLHLLLAAFFIEEYALWMSSCIWRTESPANPYYWIDLVLTVTLVLLIFGYRKAAAK
ncbi:MAG: hypothetical protein IJG63_07415 [Oscillospiraceae bacterium]|nr:hypothetical protein [Oscillospiraceae bacterium]